MRQERVERRPVRMWSPVLFERHEGTKESVNQPRELRRSRSSRQSCRLFSMENCTEAIGWGDEAAFRRAEICGWSARVLPNEDTKASEMRWTMMGGHAPHGPLAKFDLGGSNLFSFRYGHLVTV